MSAAILRSTNSAGSPSPSDVVLVLHSVLPNVRVDRPARRTEALRTDARQRSGPTRGQTSRSDAPTKFKDTPIPNPGTQGVLFIPGDPIRDFNRGDAVQRFDQNPLYVGMSPDFTCLVNCRKGVRAEFSIRAWREGEKARVVVYAKLDDPRAPGGSTETPTATFSVAEKETVQVPEAEKWGGPRLAVKAALR